MLFGLPYESWTHIGTVALVLVVPMSLWKMQPSWWAVAGATMYPVSVLISNAFHLAFFALDPLPPEYVEAMELAMDGAPPSAYGFALRIYTASKLLLVTLFAVAIFFALARADWQARAIWLILAIAEGFEFLEYAQCKMLIDPFGSDDLHLSTIWGVEVSRYSCGRAFGWLAPYMPPIITSLYLIWVNSRKSHK